MKHIIAMVLLFAAIVVKGQTIYAPDFDRKDASSITLDKIEKTAGYTIFYFTHTSSESYINGGWVNINPQTFLGETNGSRRYKLIKAEGIPYSPERHNYS